ncbi:MAG: hypothetical protein V4684_00565 [Pseudomonadota bacterium]
MRVLGHRFGWFAVFVGLALLLAATLTIWGSLQGQDSAAATGELELHAQGTDFRLLASSVPWMISAAMLVIVFVALIAAGIRDTIHSMLEMDPWELTEEPGQASDPPTHRPKHSHTHTPGG